MKIALPPLHGYQDDAIDFALSGPGKNLFARPGKGKTRVSLETIESTDKRTLVVAPLFPALTVWQQEAEKWGYNFNMRLLHGKEKKAGDEDVSIINYDGLPWLLKEPKLLATYDYIIYDEVSKMKNPGTNRFRRWRKHMPNFDYRLGLTGTPLGNHLLDLWAEMYCVDLGETLGRARSGRGNYQETYFVPHPYIPHVWEPKDDSRDIIFEKIKPNALALDYGEDELPPLILNPIPIEMPKRAREAYEEMRKASMIDGTDVIAVNAGVRSQKLRQIAAGVVYDDNGDLLKLHKAKQAALRNVSEELQGDPLLIGFEFKHDLTAIRDALGYEVPSLDGNTKPNDMVRLVGEWNDGALENLAGHPQTMGMGGNMQDSGSNVFLYTMPWSLELFEQIIDRVWRQGQKRRVTVHLPMVIGTKDYDVFSTLEFKSGEQNVLFEALSR